jgi:hypothetical protein
MPADLCKNGEQMEDLFQNTTATAADGAIVSAATKTMNGGAAAGVAGWILSNEEIASIGLGITISGFLINLVFQIRRDIREKELQRAKLKAIQKSDGFMS